MNKPFGPTMHGAIDYGFVAILALAPRLFRLTGSARTVSYAFAAGAGVLNGLTAHRLGIWRVLPPRVHGLADTPFVPTLLLLPWVTGAFAQRNARRFFVAFFAAALTNYLLTDYTAPVSDEARADDTRVSRSASWHFP